MIVGAVRPVEYERICDVMDAYFTAVREYNRALGAFDMSPAELIDARRREALNYSKVQRLKGQLQEMGIAL